jgi:GNAT superfamily N-acetyltransferase
MHCTSLRAGHAIDARRIQRLGAAVFPSQWKRYFPGGARHLEALIGSDGWDFVVAESPGGRLAGLAVVQPPMDGQLRPQPEGIWGELLFMAIAPDHRGTGLGSILLRVVEERYVGAGYLGLLGTAKPEMAGWYTARGWTALPVGQVLGFADLRRGNAAAAAGRPAPYYWTTPVDRGYPVWAWNSLDPERPVTAWSVHPDHRQPQGQHAGHIAAELERQESFGMGRLPDDVRAFLARKSLVGAASGA